MTSEIPIEEYERRKGLWLDALRSGEYAQCKEVLSDGTGYCCLGVLCEVARKEGVTLDVLHGDDGVFYDKEKELVPRKVREWIGLSLGDGTFLYDTKDEYGFRNGDSLTELNDTAGATFNEIADAIETEVFNLFTWGPQLPDDDEEDEC